VSTNKPKTPVPNILRQSGWIIKLYSLYILPSFDVFFEPILTARRFAMPTVEIKPGIHWIGVNDRTTDLFEGIWPITDVGVSYNTYLINDEKKAIIDLAKSMKTDEFFEQISRITDISTIDYLIINHMEPDHTGALKTLAKLAPRITIIGSEKCASMLADFYGIRENVKVVSDGDKISLGKHTLVFASTPFVHWPETMMTYVPEEKLLFSCDGFGGFGALSGYIFDDQCTNIEFYIKESQRYFVNIVAKFSSFVLKAIDKLKSLDVKIIAPSHGLIWRKDPGRIVSLYKEWSEYAQSGGKPGVTIVFGSMYGNTESVMNAVAHGVASENVGLEIFDAARIHSSYITSSLWTKKGVIVGAPTYETALFPPVAEAVRMAMTKKIHNKQAAFFGSYGWSKGAEREFASIVEGKWNITDTLIFPGGPSEELLVKAVELGASFARMIKANYVPQI
jgi:anaerobic nitric oxide reductase flavorubredoxin